MTGPARKRTLWRPGDVGLGLWRAPVPATLAAAAWAANNKLLLYVIGVWGDGDMNGNAYACVKCERGRGRRLKRGSNAERELISEHKAL